jgi:hypothetical protein
VVSILSDPAASEIGPLALVAHVRVSSSQQILADHDLYTAPRSLPRHVVGALTDDQETIALYVGHARDGRSALWIHVDDDAEAHHANRGLANFETHSALRPPQPDRLPPAPPHLVNPPLESMPFGHSCR